MGVASLVLGIISIVFCFIPGISVIGIVTEWDIKTASPSAATTLDMYEITHLLTEIKVKEVMTKKPLHLTEDDSVEKAALVMRNRKIAMKNAG